jgi:NADPH-dependent 2,4-dienoyl-CoA reductase/sulfur reductase-like enzyme
VKVPIIAVGRIHTPELAESVLGRGDADFIAIGRQLLADPDFPEKAEAGRTEDITPCLSCYIGCTDRLRKNLDISCLVNPLVGQEFCRPPRLTAHPQCLIVGAGPAGMSAALAIAERGARVTLVEEKSEVGGQFLWAAKVNFKQPFAKVIQVYKKRLHDLGVKLVTRKATAQWVMDQNTEFTILATGSVPAVPPIPGLEAIRHVTFGEALEKGIPEGKVLIVGGGATGCEVAELLLGQGKKVVLVEMLEQLAGDMGNARPLLLERLSAMGLEAHRKTVVEGIRKGEVLLRADGITRVMKGVECVILACGVVPNNQLECDLRKLGVAVITVGDCQKPQNGFWAIRAGFELGISLGEKQ